jgi:predicted nucleotidyltransferase
MADSDLRIQFSLDPRYQEFLNDTKVYSVLGQEVPVASVANVVRGKVWAWSDPKRRFSKRKKDELDLIRILENYPNLADLMPAEIRKQLAEG